MARGAKKDPAPSRVARKEVRRQQLIESTIASIAKRGLSETTMARVAEGAGLSQGIVNFHFQSKDALLVETLRFLYGEYRAAWMAARDKAGPGAAEKLEALLLADFAPVRNSGDKAAVWHAFYGEAKSRPTYLRLCGDHDREHLQAIRALCAEIVESGGYDGLDAGLIANGLNALLDGLSLNKLLAPRSYSPAVLKATIEAQLKTIFPKHFPISERSAA